MTRLINIDNGGTLTDFCLVDGGEVRYTKTLTTPYDLSRCLFDGLTKVSELVYSEPRLAALLSPVSPSGSAQPGQTSHPAAGALWQAPTSGLAWARRRRPTSCSPPSRPTLTPKP